MRAYYNENDGYAAAWLRNLIGAGLFPAGDVDERSIVDVRGGDLVGYGQCHFFAGIGGWPYALSLAGWPDDREAWTASLPCQPYSSAGKRLGAADERDLWPAFFRLVKQCRPAVIFGEQVASADIVGSSDDADVFSVWGGETILRISDWLERPEIFSLQGLREDSNADISKNQTSTSASQPKVASKESGLELGFERERSGQSQGSAVRDHISRNSGSTGRGALRSNGDSARSLRKTRMEFPFVGSDRAGEGIYARQYPDRDLRLQCDGKCLGGREDPCCLKSYRREEQEEFKRLVGEIGREAEEHNRLEWITRIRNDLEGCGYTFGACVLPAASAGAPHIRQRLFWVADAQFTKWWPLSRSEQDVGNGHDAGRAQAHGEPGACGEIRGLGDALAARLPAPECEDRRGPRSGHEGAATGEPGRTFWSDADWLPCLDGKARRVEPGISPLADGVPGRVGRLRAYGNAIVPQVAAEFVRAFLEAGGVG